MQKNIASDGFWFYIEFSLKTFVSLQDWISKKINLLHLRLSNLFHSAPNVLKNWFKTFQDSNHAFNTSTCLASTFTCYEINAAVLLIPEFLSMLYQAPSERRIQWVESWNTRAPNFFYFFIGGILLTEYYEPNIPIVILFWLNITNKVFLV
jgi:hypothetical protein